MKPFVIPSVYTAVDKFSNPVNKMAAANNNFAVSMQNGVARGERWFRKLTPALSETTKQMFSFVKTAAIASAVIGGITFSVNSIKEYETAVASFRTIVGGSDKEFAPYQKAINDTAKATKQSAVDTAAAFEKVAGLNAKFAETTQGITAVTKAAIILSKASRDELGSSAESLVGIMNQFSLAANQADRTINTLAAGTAVGASSIVQTADAFVNFGSVASSANITLEQSVALVQTLGKFTIFGSEAGNKLKGSLLRIQKAGVGYKSGLFNINDALAEARGKLDKLTTAKQKDAYLNKLFGAENISTGRILLSNIALFEEFTGKVTGTSEASKAAAINSNTLVNKLAELKAGWINIITSADGTSRSLDNVKNIIGFLTNNLETIVTWGTRILLFFAAWKAVLIVSSVILGAYNVALGITGALTGVVAISVGKSAIALGAYNTVTAIATAATWAWGAALSIGLWPLTLIAIAIAATIALIVVIVKKWNEWGAAIALFLGPLGLVISLIMSFKRNWDMIVDSFTKGGILEGIKAIGKTILDAILMPIQQIVGLIGKITGADWAVSAAKSIEQFRKDLGVTVEPVNPKQSEQDGWSRRMETVEKQKLDINIQDRTGRALISNQGNIAAPKVTSTIPYGN